MLFSIGDDDELEPQTSHDRPQSRLRLLAERLGHLRLPLCPLHRQLINDVEMIQEIAATGGVELQSDTLASQLAAAGYRVLLRHALGGGGKPEEGLTNLRHSFLVVTPHDTEDANWCIVEPNFREQFVISCTTSHYSAVLDSLPPVLVCTPDQLAPLVRLLCLEMAVAFRQQGMAVPPWRYTRSMLSKWLPKPCRLWDYEISEICPETAYWYEVGEEDSTTPTTELAPAPAPAAHSPHEPLPVSPWHPPTSPKAYSEASSCSRTPAFASSQSNASPRTVLRSFSSQLLLQHEEQQQQQEGQVGKVPGTPDPQDSQLHMPAQVAGKGLGASLPPRHSHLSAALKVEGAKRHPTPLCRCLDRAGVLDGSHAEPTPPQT